MVQEFLIVCGFQVVAACRLSRCGSRALEHMGLVALRHVGSSWNRRELVYLPNMGSGSWLV